MPSVQTPTAYPKAEPSVLIGIFPASCVHVRPNAATESDVLAGAYERAREMAEDRVREMQMQMDAVREEDEDELNGDANGSGPSSPVKANGPTANLLRRNHRPTSLVLAPPREKEQPPLPTLTAGDSTVAGQQWPLVDEIACAIREWYAVSLDRPQPVLTGSACPRTLRTASTVYSTLSCSTSTPCSWVAGNCCRRC